MVIALLGAHAVGAADVVATARHLGPGALWITALPGAATAIWAIWLLAGDRTHTSGVELVGGLGIALEFSVGPFAALPTLLVAGPPRFGS